MLRTGISALLNVAQQPLRQASSRSLTSIRGGGKLTRFKPMQTTKRNLWEVAKDEEGYMVYRKMIPPSKVDQRSATAVGAMFWWWLTWHFFTERGHISGSDYPWVYGSQWTNAELGIPSDNE